MLEREGNFQTGIRSLVLPEYEFQKKNSTYKVSLMFSQKADDISQSKFGVRDRDG